MLSCLLCMALLWWLNAQVHGIRCRRWLSFNIDYAKFSAWLNWIWFYYYYYYYLLLLLLFFKIGSYLTHSLKIQNNVTSCMIGLLNCSIFFIKKNCFILEKGNVSKLFPIYIYIGGLEDLGASAHFNIKPKVQAEEGNVRGWLRKAQSCWEASPRTILSSTNRCHGKKEQHTIQSNPHSRPKRKD